MGEAVASTDWLHLYSFVSKQVLMGCVLGILDKNRIKTPCGVTLMLRVSDGECL